MSHVLVVEDEPITAADLEQKLLGMGHEVTWFDTGEEALTRARDLSPDLVLMDIRLRGALNGIETARQLRAKYDVPIVFLTAFADQATVDRACATEPYGYLLKPFTERAVATAVQVALTRVQAERAGHERERWITRAVEHAGDAVIAVDDRGIIRFVNTRAEHLLDVCGADLLGKDASAVLHFAADELGGTMQPLDIALSDDRLTSAPSRTLVCTPPGSKVLVSYSAAPVHAAQRGKAGAVLVFRDVETEYGSATEDPLVALDELSRRMAHEINNPLTYNLGALQLAQRELDQLRAMSALADVARGPALLEREQLLVRIAEYLRDAREGATRIAGVVRELNLFSLSERDRAPVPPVQLIELAIGLSKVDEAHHVRWVREASAAPIVHGNKWQLAGVIAYALRNAIDALERRGVEQITVITAVETDVRGWAALRITAHGPEHSEDRASQAPSAKPQPGQSTTVSRNLAEQVAASHGGELVIVDLPAGRTIELYLPPLQVAQPEARAEPELRAARRGSVLVVDNEPMIRRALEITLRPDHDVVAVSSAQSALDLLARGDAFDVILYDLSLPDLSGPEFCARLEALRPEATQRIVLMRGMQSERDTALEQLNVRQLEKPFTTEQLLARITECMDAREPPAARAPD